MPPPLTIALMQSRPLLNPSPDTIVAALLITNPLYHKCRISDHLHLVFQWGIHTSVYLKKEIILFENVYTSSATIRQIRRHEGHPARAPDGTIMEIDCEACPGDSGESVGPWDLENVHLCAGFGDWSLALSRTLQMAFAAGLGIETVNEPKPSLEDLDKANMVDAEWLNGKPLHPTTKKNLTIHRDAIRDKLDAFLLYVDGQVRSRGRKEAVLTTLRDALEVALAGKAGGEFNGILGGMVNKLVVRAQDFLKYTEEKVESQEARNQRIDEVREIIDTALKGKEKRKRDDGEEEIDQERKKIITEGIRKATEKNLTQELTLGAPLSKGEQEARLTRARKREERKQKEWEAEAEYENSKGRRRSARSSNDMMSTEAGPSFQHSGVAQSRLDEMKNTAQTIRAAAKAKEIEAYADKGTSPRTPAPRRRSSTQRLKSPPPPYTESLFSNRSNAVSPAFFTPQTGSTFSTPQKIAGSSVPSRSTTPSHPEQVVVQKQISSAQRIMDQINNPGKRYRENPFGGNCPRSQHEPAPAFIASTKPAKLPVHMLLATSESATQTDKEMSPIYDEEEPARVTTPQVPGVAQKATAPSSLYPWATRSPVDQDATVRMDASTLLSEPEPHKEAELVQQDEDEEPSLFLPLAEKTPATATRPAPPRALPPDPAPAPPRAPASTSGLTLGPRSNPTLDLPRAPPSTPALIPEQEQAPLQKPTATAASKPAHEPMPQANPISSPQLPSSSSDTDSDSDLPPPPPTRHRPLPSKPPIYIDLSTFVPTKSPPTSLPSNNHLSTKAIKTEPSNYIIIKGEDSDSDSTRDVKPLINARIHVKGRIRAKVKKEGEAKEVGDDVVLCDGDEWAREVEEKNRRALRRIGRL